MFKKLSVLITLLIFIPNILSADGMVMTSITDQILMEASQKALISWDGTTERMLLATKVKTRDVDNYVWIVPILSTTEPEVSKGDLSIFKDLTTFLYERYDEGKTTNSDLFSEDNSDYNEDVEVVSQKEIDMYDITVLKTTNASSLIKWLNDHGYKVFDDIEPKLDWYIKQNNCYFIANKIDVSNECEDEFAEYKGYQHFEDEFKKDIHGLIDHLYEYGLDHKVYNFDVTKYSGWDINKNYLYELYNNYPNNPYLSKFGRHSFLFYSDVNEMIRDYLENLFINKLEENNFDVYKKYNIGNDFHIEIKPVLSMDSDNKPIFYNRIFIYYRNEKVHIWYSSLISINEVLDDINYFITGDMSEGMKRKLIFLFKNHYFINLVEDIKKDTLEMNDFLKDEKENHIEKYNNLIYPILEQLKTYDGYSSYVIRRYLNYTKENRKAYKKFLSNPKSLKILYTGTSDILKALFEINKTYTNKFSKLYETANKLRYGMETPLIFEFTPTDAFFPLVISTLNKGDTAVNVITLTNEPIIDNKKQLLKTKQAIIPDDINEMIKEKFIDQDFTYISGFEYKGDIRKFDNDAVFSFDNNYYKTTSGEYRLIKNKGKESTNIKDKKSTKEKLVNEKASDGIKSIQSFVFITGIIIASGAILIVLKNVTKI